METSKSPLSNVQQELLKLYSADLSEVDLQELKQVLASFYAKKAMREADKLWDEQSLSNMVMEEWLGDD